MFCTCLICKALALEDPPLPAGAWQVLLLFGIVTPWAVINEMLFPALYESLLDLGFINYSTAPSAHSELGSLLV